MCATIQGWENEGGIKVEHFENAGQQSQKLMLNQQDAWLVLHRLQAHFMSIFSKARAEAERLCSDSYTAA